MPQPVPRIMLSAAGSGAGKTTMTAALLSALCFRGLQVQGWKCGPDYIDPMFHSHITGRPAYHADPFFLSEQPMAELVSRVSADADCAVFEGAMGFYDGMGKTVEASAYKLSCTCDVPVILVVNGKGAALSLAAQIKGFKDFRPDSHIVGAIINNVNPMSYMFYKDVIERETGVKLIGYFPVMADCNFESRHLGLVTAEEISDLQVIVDRFTEGTAKSIAMESLLEIARKACPLQYEEQNIGTIGKVRIAVAQDKAFCFYYQDALDLLSELGAELVPFSPLNDKYLPENSQGIILGGGYPEIYAQQLADNHTMLESIREAVQQGMPCFAECGGFMYLLERYCEGDKIYSWVGAVEGETNMTKKLNRFGYVHLTAQHDNMLCHKDEMINGHEFHYSDSSNNGSSFLAEKASGKGAWHCAHAGRTLYAGYPHIHLWGNPEFARNFIKRCCEYKQEK